MRRALASLGVGLVLIASAVAADGDTPAAAETRDKKLKVKLKSIEIKNDHLKNAIAELSGEVESAGLGKLQVKYDTGVSGNQRVSYKGENVTVEEALDGILKGNSLGYVVITTADAKEAKFNGWLLVKQGAERGYPAGKEPKKDAAKKEEPKKDAPPPKKDDADKDEKAAAGKLSLAKTLLDAGQKDKAKSRLEEIVKDYPKTKAAEEAKKLLDKLKP